MSGKRQHVIPQFLQRGFASHIVGDQTFTWVYRKGAIPFNANIRKVGVESSFYTENDDTLADDLITKAELGFSDLVEGLRICPYGPVSDTRLAARIANLEIRTRHFRQSCAQMVDYFVCELIDSVANGAFFEYARRRLCNDRPMAERMLSEELAKRGLRTHKLGPLLELVHLQMAQLAPLQAKLAAHLESNLVGVGRDVATSAHIRALKRGAAPEPRVECYEDLHYSVVEVVDTSLILGDSPVIFQVDGPRSYKTLSEKNDVLKAAFLPLTPVRVLVGSHSRSAVSLSNLSEVIARCALEHFIAHDKRESNDLLKERIGQDAYLLSEQEIDKILTEVLNE